MKLKEMKEGKKLCISSPSTTDNVKFSDNHDDYAYSTVHRLLMAFHDDPGSPIPNYGRSSEEQTSNLTRAGSDMPGGWKGLRSEWRGVLSFDGMQVRCGMDKFFRNGNLPRYR